MPAGSTALQAHVTMLGAFDCDQQARARRLDSVPRALPAHAARWDAARQDYGASYIGYFINGMGYVVRSPDGTTQSCQVFAAGARGVTRSRCCAQCSQCDGYRYTCRRHPTGLPGYKCTCRPAALPPRACVRRVRVCAHRRRAERVCAERDGRRVLLSQHHAAHRLRDGPSPRTWLHPADTRPARSRSRWWSARPTASWSWYPTSPPRRCRCSASSTTRSSSTSTSPSRHAHCSPDPPARAPHPQHSCAHRTRSLPAAALRAVSSWCRCRSTCTAGCVPPRRTCARLSVVATPHTADALRRSAWRCRT